MEHEVTQVFPTTTYPIELTRKEIDTLIYLVSRYCTDSLAEKNAMILKLDAPFGDITI
jgi:hypothetical protein